MTFDQALRRRGGAVREDTAHACRFLESQGFQYGKHFNTRDAIQIAGEAIIELEAEYAIIERKRSPVSRRSR